MRNFIRQLLFAFGILSCSATAFSQVELIVEDIYIDCGEQFSIDILVNNFTDVLGFQFSISFNAAELQFQSYTNQMSQGLLTVNDAEASNGTLGVSWFNGASVSLPDGTVILSLEFLSVGDCSGPTAVEITGNPTAIEVSNINGPLPYTLEMGIVGFNSCDVTVDAGDDILACSPGGGVTLDASISGTATSFLWSPPDGLSDPEAVNPMAIVNGPMTYTLTVQSVSDNLVYNSDFQLENTGFTSEYDFDGILGLINNGTYIIIESPALISASFPPCVDHTDGTGMAMVVNGDNNPGDEVWCQTISIDPGTDYLLEMWVTTVIPIAPAELQFYVNGQAVGAVHSPTAVSCEWVQFTEMWNSGGDNTATFCIVSQSTASLGNDFALDDIGFYEICVESDEVNVDVGDEINVSIDTTLCDGQSFQVGTNNYSSTGNYVDILTSANGCDSTVMLDLTIIDVEAIIGNVSEINCVLDQVTLDGSSSTSGDHIGYEWMTSDGNIVSGQGTNTIQVNAAGLYQLLVTYDDGSVVCNSSEALTTVMTDTVSPTVSIPTIPTINCNQPEVQIVALPSSTGLTASWSTTDGNIVSGGDSFNPVVDLAGTYTLFVTNPQNGCENTYSIFVDADVSTPLAHIEGDTVIGCSQQQLVLDATGSSIDSTYSYQWLTTDGNIIVDTSSFYVTVDEEGTYYFVVTDTSSSCSDTASIEITSDFQVVQITLNEPGMINCLSSEVTLEAGVSVDTTLITIVWSTEGGNIVSGANSLNPVVDQAGEYTLTVTRISNQCMNEASLDVTADLQVPNADAGAEDTLTCSLLQLILDGTASDTTYQIYYQWTTQNGNIVSGENSLEPSIDQAGIYTLHTIDSTNFCTDADDVQIFEDENTPAVSIQADGVLDCRRSIITIYSAGSDTGPNFEYEWSTQGGNILTSTSADTIVADSAGTYILRITDNQSMCAGQASVSIAENRTPPTVEAGDTSNIDCLMPEINLNGTANNTSGEVEVLWSTINGNIVRGDTSLFPLVNAEGWYVITVIDPESGCNASDSVLIISQDEIPMVTVSSSHGIDCRISTTYITSEGSSRGPEFRYTWTTTDGNILSSPDADSILIDRGGTYQLTIENTNSGCSNASQVTINEDIQLPFADAGSDRAISCSQPLVLLDGSNSVQGPDILYSWTDDVGTLLPSDSFRIEVSTAGIYILFVRDTGNTCLNSDTVSVTGDTIRPDVIIAAAEVITCTRPEVTLDATASSQGASYTFQWSTVDGNIVSGDQSLNPVVDLAGNYSLQITNLDNDCRTTDMIEVQSDTLSPEVTVPETDSISCLQSSIFLTGSISPPIGDYTIVWSTQDGNIISAPDQLEIEIDQSGSYEIVVANQENGCTDMGMVLVVTDENAPNADAGPDQLLPCSGTDVLLDGSNSSSGSDILYSWSAISGSINGPLDQLITTTNTEGDYLLTVLNDGNGCSTTDTVSVHFIPIEFANLDVVDPTCNESAGSITVLSVTGGSGPFLYALDDPLQTQMDVLFPLIPPGQHTIYITDSVDCQWQQSVEIVSDTGFYLSLPAQILVQEGELVSLNPQTDLAQDEILEITWSPAIGLSCNDCLQPVLTAGNNISLTVFVTDMMGCTKSASIQIIVEKLGEIYIPNAFSPNGDGINDVFELYSSTENILVEELKIFNRWGDQVFDRSMLGISNPILAWDGTFEGKRLQTGVYVYYIVLSRFEGEHKSFQGEIYLMR